jgi:hypothetical protein
VHFLVINNRLVTSWKTDVGFPVGEKLFHLTASYPRISWGSFHRGKEHEAPARPLAFFQCHAVGHISTSPYRYTCIVFCFWTLWKCCLHPDLFLDIENIRLNNSRTNLLKTSITPPPPLLACIMNHLFNQNTPNPPLILIHYIAVCLLLLCSSLPAMAKTSNKFMWLWWLVLYILIKPTVTKARATSVV